MQRTHDPPFGSPSTHLSRQGQYGDRDVSFDPVVAKDGREERTGRRSQQLHIVVGVEDQQTGCAVLVMASGGIEPVGIA